VKLKFFLLLEAFVAPISRKVGLHHVLSTIWCTRESGSSRGLQFQL